MNFRSFVHAGTAAGFMCLGASMLPAQAMAKDTQFWNLTANTITSFELAPAGTGQWGPNQTANDADGSVDHDERLKITHVTSGSYDARFTDKAGRHCTVSSIAIKEGAVFSIDEKTLKDCKK